VCLGAPEIIYSIAPDADFQSYRTLHLENVDTGDAPFYLTLDKALRSSLAKKGYVVTDKDADLTLLYKVTIDRGEKLKEEVIPTAQGTYIRRNMEAVNEGKFLVNLVETGSGRMVWKGSTVRDLSHRENPMTLEQIETELDRFFASLPERQAQ